MSSLPISTRLHNLETRVNTLQSDVKSKSSRDLQVESNSIFGEYRALRGSALTSTQKTDLGRISALFIAVQKQIRAKGNDVSSTQSRLPSVTLGADGYLAATGVGSIAAALVLPAAYAMVVGSFGGVVLAGLVGKKLYERCSRPSKQGAPSLPPVISGTAAHKTVAPAASVLVHHKPVHVHSPALPKLDVSADYRDRDRRIVFSLRCNPRAGNRKSITMPIERVRTLRLRDDRDLRKLFEIVNRTTVNTRYPVENTSFPIAGKMVHRPNHNGTHSARQARYMEVLFNLVDTHGSPEARRELTNLTTEEKLALKMGAYFLRAGRVDESSHKNPPADDYYTRSAMLFQAYAEQVGMSPKTIAWVSKLIINSCKPYGVREKDIDTDPKNKFGYHLLTMVHEADLIRCFGLTGMGKTFDSMRHRLDHFLHPKYRTSYASRQHFLGHIYRFTVEAHRATGCRRTYANPSDKTRHGDSILFRDCSLDGGRCWDQLQRIPLPDWR